MILRGLAIWSSVGLGHLAVIGALWSGSSSAPEGRAALLLDLTFVTSVPSPPPVPTSPRIAVNDAPVAPSPSLPPPSSPAASPLPAPRFQAPAPRDLFPAPRAPSSLAAHPPRFLERVEPAYPSRARRAGVEGSVTVHLRLSERGEVLAAGVARGSGSPLLDQAALAAARASRYEPALVGGQAVPSETEATYRFELR